MLVPRKSETTEPLLKLSSGSCQSRFVQALTASSTDFFTVSGSCRVRYDNERGKGDHRHIGEYEYVYDFTTVEQLLDDFERDIANWS